MLCQLTFSLLLATFFFTAAAANVRPDPPSNPLSSLTNLPDTPTATPPPITVDSPANRPALLFSASADMYYRYHLARTGKNEVTSFTRSNNQFTLGMVSVKLEHKTNRVELVADLGFGP